jgi:hypothetical protein
MLAAGLIDLVTHLDFPQDADDLAFTELRGSDRQTHNPRQAQKYALPAELASDGCYA